MRVKLVEQISAVIGQCAGRAIHIGRVEQTGAVFSRANPLSAQCAAQLTDRELNLKAVSGAKCTPRRPKF